MENSKLFIYQDEKINKGTAWLLFLFFGWSYGSFGKIGKQILFWITIGGFGFWSLYVLFTLNKKINNHNTELRRRLGIQNVF